MSAQPLDARIAHLEGAFDQVAERLNSIDRRLDSSFAQIDVRFAQLETWFDSRLGRIEQVLESRFMWLIGLMLGTWVTLMLAVLFHK